MYIFYMFTTKLVGPKIMFCISVTSFIPKLQRLKI
jgi:hypothetical protein